MHYKFLFVRSIVATLLLSLFFFAGSAVAGPPLICHTFDIGDAKSLPWISHGWDLTGTESYNANNLSADTISILDNDPTVLLHMETLRRATLYSQKNPVATKQLLLRLIARSESTTQNTPAAALATFDVGYLAAALIQYQSVYKTAVNPAQGLDGYALVKKALLLRGNDPQMEFAATLISLSGPASEQREHAQKAIAGAKIDPLLARNLAIHFINPQSEIMADMISRNSNVKVARP